MIIRKLILTSNRLIIKPLILEEIFFNCVPYYQWNSVEIYLIVFEVWNLKNVMCTLNNEYYYFLILPCINLYHGLFLP